MTLQELVDSIEGFAEWSHPDKIRFFAWFLHSQKGLDRFTPADIRQCYETLSMEKPLDVNPYLSKMLDRSPREVLRDSRGYTLEKRVRDKLEQAYGQRPVTIQVGQLLADLPAKIPDIAERVFLDETIRCFRCQAFRATIVMAWNLAYDHLLEFVIRDPSRLSAFNAQLPKTCPKARISAVSVKDDFAELKESDVLQVIRSANIIGNGLHHLLKEKLNKRNTAAHPSSVEISPHTAEEYVIDLITNAILKLVF